MTIRALAAAAVGVALLWSGQSLAAPPPAYQWTGMYYGGHVGAGWAAKSWSAFDSVEEVTAGDFLGSGTGTGILGGVQAGMNWQSGMMVFGVEGDVSYAGIKGDAVNPSIDNPNPGSCWGGDADQSAHCTTTTDWLASITARAGVLAGLNTLLYVKAGFAFAHDSFQVHDLIGGGGCSIPGADYAAVGQGRTGGTIGVGVEHAFTPHLTVFTEYDYSDFGTQNVAFADTGDECSPAFTAAITQTVQELKVGLNLHY